MLGRRVILELEARGNDVFAANRIYDISVAKDLSRAFAWARPNVVINCAGIVKSVCRENSPYRIGAVNSVAPHLIADAAGWHQSRVVHVSTDCVFSGAVGNYTEESRPDATDLYGISKTFGELVNHEHCVTLRTSFIGLDPMRRRGLLEWLIANHSSPVPAFTRSMWSGLSAIELARVVSDVALNHTSLSGIYQVAGPVISKADLLQQLATTYDLQCSIERQEGPSIDRTLNGGKFMRATGYMSPSWEQMAEELARGK